MSVYRGTPAYDACPHGVINAIGTGGYLILGIRGVFTVERPGPEKS